MKKQIMFLFAIMATISLAAQQIIDHADHGVRLNYVAKIYGYTGNEIVVGIEDVGRVNVDKIAMRNRVNFKSTNPVPPSKNHPNHVVMKSMNAGNTRPYKMTAAYETTILSPYKHGDLTNFYSTDFLRAVNRSLGQKNPEGGYFFLTKNRDQGILDHSKFMYFFSSGNERISGDRANYGWYSTGRDYELEPNNRWARITGVEKHGKNSICVNSYKLNDLPTSSGSSGPAYDGRIKPDVTASGNATSFSTPLVTATYAVLAEAYKDQHQGQEAPSAYLKALILNTADDIGRPGPDFRSGFGKVNARRAYEAMQDDQKMVTNVNQGESITVAFDGPGNGNLTIPAPPQNSEWAQLKIMVYWHDVAENTYNSNNSDSFKALVNDINMQVVATRNTMSATFNPLVLDHRYLGPNMNYLINPAVPGIDSLNNVEQIVIDNPLEGDEIEVILSGFNIPQGPQKCYVVYDLIPKELVLTYPVENIEGDPFIFGNSEYIRWDANGYQAGDKFKIQYQLESSPVWVTIATIDNLLFNISLPTDYNHETDRHFLWKIPDDGTFPDFSRIKIRVKSIDASNNTIDISKSGFITIAREVEDVEVLWTEEIGMTRNAQISWAPLNEATSYEVYRLGIEDKFMTLETSVNNNTAFIEDIQIGPNGSMVGSDDWNEWISIVPVKTAGGIDRKGQRSKPVEIPRGSVGYGLAQGATNVHTKSATLHAKLFPRNNVVVNTVQFQIAVDDGANIFENTGPVFDNSGNGYTSIANLETTEGNISNPFLDIDQDYQFRIEMGLDTNTDGIIDQVEYSNVSPVQSSGGSATHLNEGSFYTMEAIPEYFGNGSKTIEFWASANNFNYGNLINIGEGNEEGTDLDALVLGTSNLDNQWQWIVNNSEEYIFEIPGSLNELRHFAIVYDQTAMQLYLVVDGAIVDASVINNLQLDISEEDIQIGGRFDGVFDEVRFWDGVRSLDQIRETMHYSIKKTMNSNNELVYPSDLLRYLQFDDKSSRPFEAVELKNILSTSSPTFTNSKVPMGIPGFGNSQPLNQGWNFFQYHSTWIITLNGWVPQGEISVSRIHSKPHEGPTMSNILDLPTNVSAIDEVFEKDYRALHNYCEEDPNTLFRLKFLLPLQASDLNHPEKILLLGRSKNYGNTWQYLTNASQITQYDNPDIYHAFFDNLESFDQFVAIRVTEVNNLNPQTPPVNILESAKLSEIIIYPNPIKKSEEMMIQVPDYSSPLDLYIYDQLGRVVGEYRIDSPSMSIPLNRLSTGVFICKIVDRNKEVATKKIVVFE